MLSKLDGRAWRWLSPAAADGFEPVFSRSWGPDAPSRPGRAAGSCPRWESSKANLIWTRVCSHQYHQLVQAKHSVHPVKYRDTWYLCPLGNPDIAKPSAAAGLAMMLPPVANAQDVTETDVDVTTPDGVADCYFVHPSTGQHPAVIIWPDILGLRPAFRAMGERLAQSGYSVLVVNPFYRDARAPVVGEGASFGQPEIRNIVLPMARNLAISEFPKWSKYLILLSFQDNSSARSVQIGGWM